MSCVHSGKCWRLSKSCTERSDNAMQKFDGLAGLHAQHSPAFWCRRCASCSPSLDKNMEILWKILQKIYVGAEGSHFVHTERQPCPQSQASEDFDKTDIHISRWYSRVFSFKVSAQVIHSRLFSAQGHNKCGNYGLQLCTSKNTEHLKAQSVLQRDDDNSRTEQ